MRRTIDRDRLWSGVLTAAVVMALGYALVAGLAVSLPVKTVEVMKLFAFPAPPGPEPRPKPLPHPRRARKEGAAAPANKRSQATQVALPPPIVPPVQPPPVAAAAAPAAGINPTSGAAPVVGPGTGAGGQGAGTGSGRGGNGDGDGGTPLRRIGGVLRARDIPAPIVRDLLATGVTHYVVSLRFTVGIAGRVTDCAISRTSGSAALDGATCRLIVDKLRYRPELDGGGRPVPVTVVGTQEWTIGGTPPPGRDADDD